MVELGINRQYVLLQLRRSDILKFQRLDSIRKETTRTFKHRIRIAHQVDELGIREHLHQFLHTSRMRRVLTEELSSMRIPQGNLDKLGECFFKYPQLCFAYIIKQQILICIFLLVLRQKPEIVVGIRHHIRQCKLFFLRQVHSQLHIIRRTLVGHQPAHILLEERLPPHHQMRKYGLISCVIAKVLITREHIMHESCSAAPVPEDKNRIMFQRLGSQ